MFQGEATSVADEAIRSFRAERLRLGAISALAVQPNGGELCGASGNCSFWIVDLLHRRILLRAEGVQAFGTEPAKPGTVPAVITATHESATEYEKIRWQFIDGHYEPQSCATVARARRCPEKGRIDVR